MYIYIFKMKNMEDAKIRKINKWNTITLSWRRIGFIVIFTKRDFWELIIYYELGFELFHEMYVLNSQRTQPWYHLYVSNFGKS